MLRKSMVVVFVSVAALAFLGLAIPDNHGNEEANMTLMKKFYEEVANKGNIDYIDESFAENFVEHEEAPGLSPDREGVKQFFKMLRSAFPDLNFKVAMLFAKDDKVVATITISGTNKGEFMGMQATGKKISIKGIDIVRFEDGKAVEHWGLTDSITMMQQLGAIPTEETSAK